MAQQIYSQPSALGGIVEFAVEIALGATEGGDDVAIWQPDPEGALWDTKGVWSGVVPSWVDVTSRVAAVNTRRGRDRFEQQFRVGQCVVVLHNDDGIFTPDADKPPGAVALRPGRWLRVLGRRTDGALDFDPTRFLLNADTGVASGMEAPLPTVPAAGYKVKITNAITAVTHTSDQPLVSAYSGAAGNRLFQIEQRTDDTIRAVMSHDTTATQAMTAPGTFPPGTPMDIELVVDYSIPEATLTVNGAPIVLALTATGPNTTVAPFTIGRRALSQQAGLFWRGTVEQAALLTLGDVPLVTADFNDPGLVGSLDGVNWLDSQGNAWSGLIGSAAEGTVTDPNVWVPLWTGQIDAMEDLYQSAANAIDSRFTSLDFGARFQIDDPPALETPIPAGQLTSDRINQLLDEVNWPNEAFWRDIDDGENTMADSTLAQSRWAEMQVAATAEDGSFFISAGGVPTFKSRDWLVDKIGGPTKFTIGAVASDVKIMAASTDWSQQRVYGDVRMARKGGTEYRTVSEDSISLYGRRTLRRFDIECQTDNQLIAIADRRLGIAQFDRSRVESIDLVPLTAEGVTQLLNVTLGDLIRVTVQTRGEGNWAYTDDYFVNQVTHEISDEDWVTTLRIDAASFDVPLLPAAYTDGFDDGFDSQDPG